MSTFLFVSILGFELRALSHAPSVTHINPLFFQDTHSFRSEVLNLGAFRMGAASSSLEKLP
jgi:hypothetical protein